MPSGLTAGRPFGPKGPLPYKPDPREPTLAANAKRTKKNMRGRKKK